MEFSAITALVSDSFSDAVLGEDKQSFPQTLIIEASQIESVCLLLRDHDQTFFDMLSCLTGVDNGLESGTMEVIYHLNSIPFQLQLALKVVLPREAPVLPSVVSIWKTANWHEREAFDLFGIRFTNHPDLRRILLPEDWEGHPLRKDYQAQEKYHGIIVKY